MRPEAAQGALRSYPSLLALSFGRQTAVTYSSSLSSQAEVPGFLAQDAGTVGMLFGFRREAEALEAAVRAREIRVVVCMVSLMLNVSLCVREKVSKLEAEWVYAVRKAERCVAIVAKRNL